MPDELIKKTKAMLGDLHTIEGVTQTYLFSDFFKPVNIPMSTIFGVVGSFPNWEDFSENKINGLKAIANQYSDLLTVYVRIGNTVYQPTDQHEYKTLPSNESRELIKALVGRAVKVSRFDLSMLNPKWLENSPSTFNPEKITPVGSMPIDNTEIMDR